jgi:hypothetical protein
MLTLLAWGAGVLAGAVSADLDEGPWLMATKSLTLPFAGLTRAGLAGHGR